MRDFKDFCYRKTYWNTSFTIDLRVLTHRVKNLRILKQIIQFTVCSSLARSGSSLLFHLGHGWNKKWSRNFADHAGNWSFLFHVTGAFQPISTLLKIFTVPRIMSQLLSRTHWLHCQGQRTQSLRRLFTVSTSKWHTKFPHTHHRWVTGSSPKATGKRCPVRRDSKDFWMQRLSTVLADWPASLAAWPWTPPYSTAQFAILVFQWQITVMNLPVVS